MTQVHEEIATAKRPVLAMRGISKSYGPVRALSDASIESLPGEIHALLGENGAGKSTLISIATGVLDPDAGKVEIDGSESGAFSPAAVSAAGVVAAYQDSALVPDLSIAENLAFGRPRGREALRGRKLNEWAREALALFGRDFDPRVRPIDLSASDRQVVEITRALIAEPRLLILDEPTASLAGPDVERLFEILKQRVAEGLSVIYITHRLREVLDFADRATVLRDGKSRGPWPVGDVSEEDLLREMLGRSVEAAFPERDIEPGPEPGLVVESLRAEGLDQVSFSVRPGEIVGLAGVEGNGQRELVRALAGLHSSEAAVFCNGQEIKLGHIPETRTAGLTYISADRRGESLATSLTVMENLVSPIADRVSTGGWVRRREERALAEKILSDLKIKAPSVDVPVERLSGGNQQKVALGRALLSGAKVLVVEEPTQGVDAGARVDFYEHLVQAAREGMAVLVCSSDAVELAGICDRVMVMSRGRIVEVVEDELSEDRIMAPALTHTSEGSQASASTAKWRPGSHWAMPTVLISLIAALMFFYTAGQAPRITATASLIDLALLMVPMALVAYAQGTVMIAGGVDLSVGPVMGLVTVVVSFLAVEPASSGGIAFAALVAIGIGVAVGGLNAFLVHGLRINAVAATLATFIGVTGVGLVLRPSPGGSIGFDFVNLLTTKVANIPVAFIGVIALGVLLEYWIRQRRTGWSLRAVGSREISARRLGIPARRVQVLSYIGAGVLAALAGLFLATATGVGDALSGEEFTLQSITAVALGGATLAGGRGSFLGAFAGVVLLAVIISAGGFMQWGVSVASVLTGALMIIAITMYSYLERGRRHRSG